MEIIVLQSILWLLWILGVVLAPTVGFWWLIKRGVVLDKPRFPDSIYGVYSGLRYQLLQVGAVGSLFYCLVLCVIWSDEAPNSEAAQGFLVMALITGSMALFFGRKSFQIARLRRSYERTYEEGVRVTATVVDRNENTLRGIPGSCDPTYTPENMVARGAYLVIDGPWKVTIRFELDGQTIEDTRRVCSRVFYHFRSESTLPILVRPEDPLAWVPELEPRAERGKIAASHGESTSLEPSH